MTLRIRVTPQADREFRNLTAYLARSSAGTALRFQNAVEQTLQTLTETPEIGALFPVRNPRLEGLRCWPVRRFKNHLIFYRPTAGWIEVLHFLYGTRDVESILEGEQAEE